MCCRQARTEASGVRPDPIGSHGVNVTQMDVCFDKDGAIRAVGQILSIFAFRQETLHGKKLDCRWGIAKSGLQGARNVPVAANKVRIAHEKGRAFRGRGRIVSPEAGFNGRPSPGTLADRLCQSKQSDRLLRSAPPGGGVCRGSMASQHFVPMRRSQTSASDVRSSWSAPCLLHCLGPFWPCADYPLPLRRGFGRKYGAWTFL